MARFSRVLLAIECTLSVVSLILSFFYQNFLFLTAYFIMSARITVNDIEIDEKFNNDISITVRMGDEDDGCDGITEDEETGIGIH